MIYLSFFMIFIVYIYLLKKHYNIFKLIPTSKAKVYSLYSQYKIDNSIYKIMFNLVIVIFSLLVMAYLLKLNYIYLLTIIIILIMLMPLILSFKLDFFKDVNEFNNLVTYLSQFILIFKDNPKVLYVLNEVVDSVDNELRVLVKKSIKDIEAGVSINLALDHIKDAYPHFIVHNLFSLCVSVEMYGSNDFYEALDLIQDDVDDWIEDINKYNYDKQSIIKKTTFLILFAFVICFMSLKMLFSLTIEINNTLYQSVIFLFLCLQIMTYVLAHFSMLNSFLDESECL